MKLSIIIPIYNVEDTLRCCLESVLGQMDDRMEVIIVDDGSTDTSGQIAEQMTAGRTDCRLIRRRNRSGDRRVHHLYRLGRLCCQKYLYGLAGRACRTSGL